MIWNKKDYSILTSITHLSFTQHFMSLKRVNAYQYVIKHNDGLTLITYHLNTLTLSTIANNVYESKYYWNFSDSMMI